MGRPRNPNRLATVQFNPRVTVGQMMAIQVLSRKWADEMRAKGLPLLGDNMTAWFRALVQKEAAAQGVTITEPSAESSPSLDPAASSAEPSHKASTRPPRS